MFERVISFAPPHVGLDGEFNTFRLGLKPHRQLQAGDFVSLLDTKEQAIFGRAQVVKTDVGSLAEMCAIHAPANHTELQVVDPENSPARLFAYVQKLYGPHIAGFHKKTSVIYLRRIE